MNAFYAGNNDSAERHAKSLLRTYTAADKQSIKNGIDCLKRYNGKTYKYYPKLKKFLTDEEHAALTPELESAARQEAERAKQEEIAKANEAADREKRERELQKLNQIAAEHKAERERAVLRALSEACETKFHRDTFEAITNKLCFDYFMLSGLPD